MMFLQHLGFVKYFMELSGSRIPSGNRAVAVRFGQALSLAKAVATVLILRGVWW